jgi:ferritin-like metal-binding protein YciE
MVLLTSVTLVMRHVFQVSMAQKKGEVAMESLQELLEEEVKDLYSAENQILKALPKIIKKVSSSELKTALSNHLKETEGHVSRLEQIGTTLDIELGGKKCQAMAGLVEEGGDFLKEDGHDAVIDAGLIGAARRVEHYEMAAYCAARAIAEQLGLDDVAGLLKETLQEEAAADETLKTIARDEVLPDAAESPEELEADGGKERSR